MDLYNIKLILWAFPVFISLHVVEEFWFPGGFIQWMAKYNSVRLKNTYYYVAINAVGIIAGIIVALTATNVVGYCVFIWFVTFMAMNGLSHTIASFQNRTYCPGMVTGIVLFFPLLFVGYWKLATENLVNWQALALNAISAIVVGFFFITVHQRKKAVKQ